MEGLATEAGKQFLTQGILGTLCIILFGTIVYLYRDKKTCEAARLAELERMIEAREALAKALAANTLALEANNKASEARMQATEDIAREVADLKQTIHLAVQQNGFDLRTLTSLVNDIKHNRSGPA